MKYRLSCLTPVLVGDGASLSPVDYMVWKDHVNVLDQRRIFRLLAKGPRLEGYLTQIRKAEKLDFASWGGFAQNFAGRRIPFEHGSAAGYWERLRAEDLHIPTFASGASGPYLPASALRGALRTAMVGSRLTPESLKKLAGADRPPRRLAEPIEREALGSASRDRLRAFAASDSAPVAAAVMKIYLLRTAGLQPAAGGKLTLAWKGPRGWVETRRLEESTPAFAEMAPPGTAFSGEWVERGFARNPEIAAELNWGKPMSTADLLEAANNHAARLLAVQLRYAQTCGLILLARTLEGLRERLEAAGRSAACLVSIGWGAGLIGKSACLDTGAEAYRDLLRATAIYAKAVRAGLPFPKTRRIVFVGNQPATMPGWALLEVG